VLTYGVARLGSDAAIRFVSRGRTPEQLARARQRFAVHGWQLVVVGRLVPAGRIPALVAAGTLGYPWKRLLPSAFVAALLWAVAYALLGVLSGGLFDNPLLATLVATGLVLLVGLVTALAGRYRRRRGARLAPPTPDPSATDPTETSRP
jgi:membrane protein DedA with SNARE-associated domain